LFMPYRFETHSFAGNYAAVLSNERVTPGGIILSEALGQLSCYAYRPDQEFTLSFGLVIPSAEETDSFLKEHHADQPSLDFPNPATVQEDLTFEEDDAQQFAERSYGVIEEVMENGPFARVQFGFARGDDDENRITYLISNYLRQREHEGEEEAGNEPAVEERFGMYL